MRHPLEKLTRAGLAWPVLAATVALSLWFGLRAGGDGKLPLPDEERQGSACQKKLVGAIGCLELAGSAANAAALIRAWDDRGLKGEVRKAIYYDFAFIALYATNLALFCLLAANVFEGRRLAAAGAALAWGGWLAGGFDVLENFTMLRMLGRGADETWARACWLFASLKFALIGACALYSLAGLAVWAARRLRTQAAPRAGGAGAGGL